MQLEGKLIKEISILKALGVYEQHRKILKRPVLFFIFLCVKGHITKIV